MPTKSITTRFPAVIATALAAALLMGCEGLMPHKAPLPSASGVDGTCVSNCELKKTQCEQRQVLREQTCRDYQMQFETSRRPCVAHYGSHCLEPVECIGANLDICQTEMNECILDCQSAPASPSAAPEPTTDPAIDAGASTDERQPPASKTD